MSRRSTPFQFTNIHGQPLGRHQDCVAYVPQREEVDWRFPVTVSDVVMMGRFAQMGWWKRASAAPSCLTTSCAFS